MGFWIRNIIFGIVLIGLAVYFLQNQDYLLSLISGSNEQTATTVQENTEEASSEKKTTAPPKPISTNKNAAADGLSKFYASINPDLNDKGPRIKNNIVYLPDPKGDIVELLEARRIVVRPLKASWKGTKSSRPFRLGQTLFQKLSEYSNADGLEVFWWLNKDFLVKDAFRINKDIITTSYQVGKAIEGHFINGISIYFCHQQRAIVLIDQESAYLDKECQLLPRK